MPYIDRACGFKQRWSLSVILVAYGNPVVQSIIFMKSHCNLLTNYFYKIPGYFSFTRVNPPCLLKWVRKSHNIFLLLA